MSIVKFPIVGVVPSLNPDEMMLDTINSMITVGFTNIILVDDGSHKKCKKYFDKVGKKEEVIVLHHKVNMGKGAALKTAFKYYLENYDLSLYKGVITADADGQHLAEDIKHVADEMLAYSATSKYLFLGTRNFDAANVPPKSKTGNKITTRVFKMLFGKLINDTQTGLRGISNDFLAKCVELKENRFEYEINMLIEAVRDNLDIREVDIETVYYESNRETHFRPIEDSLKIYRIMLRTFLKFSCSGIISWVIDWGIFSILSNIVLQDPNSSHVILLATIVARVVSSIVNYAINRKVVFGTGSRISLVRYYLLCTCQLFVSAFLVSIVCAGIHINSSVFKIVVDAIIFCVNYKIQQNWVFKGKES